MTAPARRRRHLPAVVHDVLLLCGAELADAGRGHHAHGRALVQLGGHVVPRERQQRLQGGNDCTRVGRKRGQAGLQFVFGLWQLDGGVALARGAVGEGKDVHPRARAARVQQHHVFHSFLLRAVAGGWARGPGSQAAGGGAWVPRAGVGPAAPGPRVACMGAIAQHPRASGPDLLQALRSGPHLPQLSVRMQQPRRQGQERQNQER